MPAQNGNFSAMLFDTKNGNKKFQNVIYLRTLRIGVHDLYYGGGTVGRSKGTAIGTADAGVACKNVSAAVFTAKDSPFAEHCQTAQSSGAAWTVHGVSKDAVVKGDVDAVVIPVKGHGFYINIGVHQFGAADPYVGGGIQNLLGRGC